jgi:hypothetical protein
LDAIVDATYVIHLVGNGREKVLHENLAKLKPSTNTFVLYNAGHKSGLKRSFVDTTSKDIVDANLQVFKHALQEGYGNILVLEDDFFFDESVRSKVLDIHDFMKEHRSEAFVYSLGCLPFFALPTDEEAHHWYGPFLATHACIFSPEYRESVLASVSDLLLWDWELVNPTGYFYHEPLFFQLFPKTENRKKWGYDLIEPMYHLVQWLADGFIPFFDLDKSTKGYYLLYFLAKWWILILVIAYFVVSFFFGLALQLIERIMRSVFRPLTGMMNACPMPSLNPLNQMIHLNPVGIPRMVHKPSSFDCQNLTGGMCMSSKNPLIDFMSLKVQLPDLGTNVPQTVNHLSAVHNLPQLDDLLKDLLSLNDVDYNDLIRL